MIAADQFIEQGRLVHEQDRRHAIPFHLRRLDLTDRDQLVRFRERIFAALPDPDMYVPEVPEFVDWHLSGERGLVFGIFSADQLIACSILGIPRPGMPNFADDLPVAIDPQRVVHIASSMVAPEFRGFGLQKRLIAQRILIAIGLDRPILLARAALSNIVSWRNMLGAGLHIAQLLIMHQTRYRFLLARDLSQSPPHFQPVRTVLLQDIPGHQQAIREGLVGYDFKSHPTDPGIIYGHQ